MTIAEWILVATIVAIVVGPIVATQIAQRQEAVREIRQRKLAVYRALMETRGSRLHSDHIRALNLIPLEYYGIESVMSAFRVYMTSLATPLPHVDQQSRFLEQRNDGFLDLLHQVGLHLGYRVDRRELERLAYTPQGVIDNEERQLKAQALLIEIMSGQRSFPVAWMLPPGSKNPYPPAPEKQV